MLFVENASPLNILTLKIWNVIHVLYGCILFRQAKHLPFSHSLFLFFDSKVIGGDKE